MQLSITALFAILIFFGSAHATDTTLNSSVRALGMGDAFTAVANDDSSLFYNPAGLARVRGLNLKVFDLDAGASGLSAYKKFISIKGTDTGSNYADKIQEFYGEHVWTGVGGEAMFTMPMFGFGAYDHLSSTLRINNPVYPQIHTRIINDYGYVMGFGAPVSPFMHLGLDLKYIKRTGTDTVFGPSFIADLDPKTITDSVSGWGTGYGFDLGTTFIIPAPFFSAALSVAWKNVGGIEFISATGSKIPSEPNNITAGAAISVDTPIVSVTPAVDFQNLNDANMQLTRKVNLGIEIGLPLIDIRGGFHEGYYTAGLGLNMGLFRVDAATYGVELGDYPGQIEDRRYVVQFTMQLGIGNFSATGDSKSGSGGSSGSGKDASSSDSIWGGKKLKRRR